MDKIILDAKDQEAFEHMFMIGIAEQLRSLGMLSDAQLRSVISKLNAKNSCTSCKCAV